MKNIKKISKTLAIAFILSSLFCIGAFAHTENCVEIEKNNKIYACLPEGYEYYGYTDNLCYCDAEGNTIAFGICENKFAPNGITELNESKIQTIFDYIYLAEGDMEYVNSYDVTYSSIEKRTVNGMQAYEIKGHYENTFVYPFCAYIFATKEDVIAVVYEDINDRIADYSDIKHTLETLVINGTYLGNDKPTVTYNFEGLPSFEQAIEQAEESYDNGFYDDIMGDGLMNAVAGFIVLFTVVPTLVIVIIAIVSIVKYIKNKEKLSQYERVYGPLEMYNAPMQYPGQNFAAGYSQNYGSAYNQSPANPYNIPYSQQAQPVTPIQQNPTPVQPQEEQTQTVQNNLSPELYDSVKEDKE